MEYSLYEEALRDILPVVEVDSAFFYLASKTGIL